MKIALKYLIGILFLAFVSCTVTSESSFVEVQDGHFVQDGRQIHFVGTNFWYGAILGSEGVGGDRARLNRELDTLKSLGVTNLRVLVGGDGPDGVIAHIEPTLQKAPLQYNDTIFAGLDYLLTEMAAREMKAVLFINNSWEWTGGFGQYLEWAGVCKALIPSIDGYGPFMQQMSLFNTSEAAQELFFDNLRHIVSRTNSITGIPYAEDPTIFSWQICNEPRPFSDDPAVVEGFYKWIWEAAGIIKSIDPNHMVSTGNEGMMGSNESYEVFDRLNSCEDIDYITAHIWPFNWSWINGDCPQDDLDVAISRTGDYIDRHLEVAAKYNKPLVIEEFGFPRDDHQFAQGTPTTGRDSYYDFIFGRVVDSYREDGLLAGANFWGWGGLAAQPQGHLNWQKGDDYCGDPSQEEQGLNSVYVGDSSTISIIKAAARRLSAPQAQVILSDDWMLSKDKPLQVSVANVEEPVSVRISISTDFGEPVEEYTQVVRRDGTITFKLKLSDGFYNVKAYLDDEQFRSLVIGYGDPEAVISEQDKPEDFDEFWEHNLAELAMTEPHYSLTYMPEYSNDIRSTWRLDMISWGGEPITGVLVEPVAEGSYPAYISYMGYNCQPWMEDPSANPDIIQFTLCTRRQGWSRIESEPADFVYRGIESPDTYYYRGAFLDCVRGVDFICSRPNVDLSRVYAEGGSQGGAFTLVAASLDARIKGIAPYVPFLSDFPDYFRLASWPGNEVLPAAQRLGIPEDKLYETLSYFDVKNFTDRIQCPVLMGFGLQDDTCPPHTNFSGFNQISSPKRWVCFPLSGHHVEEEPGWWTERNAFFAALNASNDTTYTNF